jgi:hypothetical protein
MMLAALLLMLGVAMVPSFLWRLAVVPVEAALFLALGWRWLLGDEERQALRAMIRKVI